MADYCDYMAEMQLHEKSNTQERLKLAKKRRQQQLKRWNQREQELCKKGVSGGSADAETNGTLTNRPRSRNDNVHFEPSVVFFEAATRNDIEEGNQTIRYY
jgi:hypothetical protein